MQEFVDSTQKLYQADMQAVDFIGSSEESRKLINQWVEEKTQGKKLNSFTHIHILSKSTT